MKWPWVSRARLEAAEAMLAFERQMAQEKTALVLMQQQAYDKLLTTVLPPTPEPGLAPERKSSVIREAIRREAGTDARLANYFWKRVRELRNDPNKRLTDDEIAAEIGRWDVMSVEN